MSRMQCRPKNMQSEFRKKLQAAYEKDDYEKAKLALLGIKKELHLINESAAASMEEGFEESLTVHRLGAAQRTQVKMRGMMLIAVTA